MYLHIYVLFKVYMLIYMSMKESASVEKKFQHSALFLLCTPKTICSVWLILGHISHDGFRSHLPVSINFFYRWFVCHLVIRIIPLSLSGEPDYFGRNKILSGYDLSHYQVPHCIRVFFYFVWFVFIHHNFQFYFKLCTYCNILDIYLS